MRLPIPGCVGFVDFFSSSAAGVASLKAPKPLRQDGVEARPFSADVDVAALPLEDVEEAVLDAAGAAFDDDVDDAAVVAVFPPAVFVVAPAGSLS